MNVYDIALTLTPGLGVRGAVQLLDVFCSAEKIFNATLSELTHFAELNETVAKAIVGRVAISQAEQELKYCCRHAITAIASTDEGYPPQLLTTPDYPHVIYVMGDPSVLCRQNVSVVGTRRISSYGDRMCNEMIRDLGVKVPNLVVVSGLAFGVDGAAHRAALHHDIPTVAVVANALPSVTPTQHTALASDIIESGGAIVSECHSQTKNRGNLYIARNRIIAALSGVTVVVESPLTGGSMATAAIASGYDRVVMAIPARLTDLNSAGCNMLIRNNQAQLYLSPDQLIREMMWDCNAPTDRALVTSLNSDFTDEQNAILVHFTSDEPLSVEELSELTQLPVSSLSSKLLELELLGAIRMLHGNRYELLSAVVSR